MKKSILPIACSICILVIVLGIIHISNLNNQITQLKEENSKIEIKKDSLELQNQEYKDKIDEEIIDIADKNWCISNETYSEKKILYFNCNGSFTDNIMGKNLKGKYYTLKNEILLIYSDGEEKNLNYEKSDEIIEYKYNNNIYKLKDYKTKRKSGVEVPVATDAKPIIYLYPQEMTKLTVKLGNPQKITCSYPKYKEIGWNVTANTDGTLIYNETGKSLYSLYWEGKDAPIPDMKEGFIVKGEDVAKFLEEKLKILGLNEREAEEFIIYWLPKMEKNKYNYVRFATIEEINKYMPLEFSKEPDTIIRVLMQFKGLNNPIEVEEQQLITPERKGFVAVEWGGIELN